MNYSDIKWIKNNMSDGNKSNEQLLSEIAALQKHIAELETASRGYRQAEAATQRTETEQNQPRHMLQLILDTIPQRVFWKDKNFSFLGCNVPFAQDAGLKDPREIIGKNDFDLPWKGVAPLYRTDDREVMETNTPKLDFEEPQIAPDGKKLWLRTNKVPLHDESGNVIGVLGTYQDITKLKQAEEELRNEKALLDALMDHIPDSIYFKDRQCRHIRVNRKEMQDLHIDDMNQIIGKTDVDLWGEEFGRNTFLNDQHLIESGEPIIGQIECRQLKDSKLWTSTTKVPFRDPDGQIIGLVGITRDISEFMKTQQERERLIKELQDALADIKTLSGLVPICSNCKKIRDDKGYWTQLEAFIQEHSEARFSHGICPDCMEKLYPDFMPKKTV
jgi:PAS domain S-box-containing protein